jgi:surface antigen
MGHGLEPAPLNDLGSPVVIDPGTSARTGSPTPGPVGMDSGNASPQKSQASMSQQILSFIKQRMGTRHGNGECFTLADDALKNAGAKSAADYSKLTPDTDYVWGTAVSASDVKAGDVVQFRSYRYDRKVVTKNPDRSVSTDEDFQERPHHTAIVEQVNGDGSMTVLEQNAPVGESVSRNTLYFSSSTTKSDNSTTTIKVKGTVRFYRPQSK